MQFDCTHPLLAELKGTLVEALSKELHGTTLVWGVSADITDHIAGKFDLDTEFPLLLGRALTLWEWLNNVTLVWAPCESSSRYTVSHHFGAASQVTDVGVFSFDTKPNAKSPPGSSLPHTLVPLPSPPFL